MVPRMMLRKGDSVETESRLVFTWAGVGVESNCK